MSDFWNQAWLIIAGLLPFLGFLVVCYVIVRAIFNADRNERKAQLEWERTQRQEQAADSTESNHPGAHPGR